MARLGLLLLILLLTPLRSNAQDTSCYCTSTINQLYGNCYANTSCWACQPGAYDTNWQQMYCQGYTAPVTCTSTFAEKQESCALHYSGGKFFKQETVTCSDGKVTVQPWQLYSDTCVADPPTCQQSSETQSGTCPVHTTGTVTSTRTSTCSDPYGSPVWSPWNTVSNCVQDPPTCRQSSESKTEGCPTHFTGSKTYVRNSTCSDPYGSPVWGDWVLTSNTCTPDPATCIPSTQTQTLQCDSGYVGQIIQDRVSTCPNPYGSPVWGAWMTSSNTCVKSVTNPTNPLSPVSPISPVSPVNATSAVSTPTSVVPVPGVSVLPTTPPTDMQSDPTSGSSEPPSQTSTGTSDAPSQGTSATSTPAKSGAKGKGGKDAKEEKKSGGSGMTTKKPSGSGLRIGGFSLGLSLELFIKPGYQQPQMVNQLNFTTEIPNEYRRSQDFLLELITPDDAWIDPNRIACDRGFSLCGDYLLE